MSLQGAGGVGGLLAMVVGDDGYFYCFDANGNVVQLVDGVSGDLGARYEYDAFGNSSLNSNDETLDNFFRFFTKYFDCELDQGYFGYRYYLVVLGRWISKDPLGEIGGVNQYCLSANDALNSWDILGCASGKGAPIAWVVKRLKGKKFINIRPIYTHKEAAQLMKKLPKGFDIRMVRIGSKSEAMKVARIVIKKKNLLKGRGHAKGHLSKKTGLRGAAHIQDNTIDNRHIFYRAIAGLLTYSAVTDETEANAKDIQVTIDEVWTDPYPGESIANKLTFKHWFGEDSRLSYLDWVNPFDLVALGGDVGRSIDRKLASEQVGIIVTVIGCGEPKWTFSFDPEGNVETAAKWSDGVLIHQSIDDIVGQFDSEIIELMDEE